MTPAYQPRAGSVGERAIAYLRENGRSSIGDLCDGIDIERYALGSSLNLRLMHGLILKEDGAGRVFYDVPRAIGDHTDHAQTDSSGDTQSASLESVAAEAEGNDGDARAMLRDASESEPPLFVRGSLVSLWQAGDAQGVTAQESESAAEAVVEIPAGDCVELTADESEATLGRLTGASDGPDVYPEQRLEHRDPKDFIVMDATVNADSKFQNVENFQAHDPANDVLEPSMSVADLESMKRLKADVDARFERQANDVDQSRVSPRLTEQLKDFVREEVARRLADMPVTLSETQSADVLARAISNVVGKSDEQFTRDWIALTRDADHFDFGLFKKGRFVIELGTETMTLNREQTEQLFEFVALINGVVP